MRLRIACDRVSKAVGLLSDGRILVGDDVLLLVPCHDIHTFGMTEPIDVAFIDETGCVVRTYRQLAPYKRLTCAQACAVLERVTPKDERDISGEVPVWKNGGSAGDWFVTGQNIVISGDDLVFECDEELLDEVYREEGDDEFEGVPTL